MHSIFILLIFLLSLPSFARVVELDRALENHFSLGIDKNQELVLHWQLSNFEAREFNMAATPLVAEYFSQIKLKDFSSTHEPYSPSLPYYSFIVMGDLKDLEIVVEAQSDHFFPELHAAPAPQMPCRCGPQEKTWGLKLDSPLNQFHYSATALGDFRGLPLTQIVVSPFQATKAGLKVSADFKLRVQGAQGLFEFAQEWERTRTGRYIIVAPSAFVSALDPLVEWRQGQGHEVLVLPYEGESFNALKNKLQQMYRAKAYDFALLVGSEDLVPTEYVETSTDWNTPSDMNYFTMGGERDLIPDVVYARMVVNNRSDIERQIEKTLHYELNQYQDDSGLERALGIASDEGYNPSDYEYIQQMLAPLEREFQIRPHYFFQRETRATAQNLIQSLSQGAHWLNYIGHGIGDAWPSITGRAFTVDDLKQISPRGVKPVVVDVACQNGRLSFDRRIGVSLMNQFNQGLPAGAVAYYGGSVDITWHPPALMAVKINEIVGQRQVDQLGPALMAGQLKLLEIYDDLPSALENLVWYHLQGDPALELQLGL